LREISGLALTPDGRVMGHDDELASLYQIDIETGQLVKRFSLGRPVVRGDFEGLAIGADGAFYLSTSNGLLYRFYEGEDGARVGFEAFDTGLRSVGEIEGLAFLEADEKVIIATKTNYSAAFQAVFALYAWSPRIPDQPARPWLTVPVYAMAGAVGARSFHPSALEIDPRTGRLIVLAALENAMVELDAGGQVLAARRLGPRHRQPEGATILTDGALVIADEGAKLGQMTRYARVDG
jgi:uncharacterized protein YjiK